MLSLQSVSLEPKHDTEQLDVKRDSGVHVQLLLRPLLLPLPPALGGANYEVLDERVCVSFRWHISKTARLNFTKFSVHINSGRGSVLL